MLIDGSEAGGQLVRTACALSAITGKPFKIINIRVSRPNPGLQTQHMEGVKSIAELCNAETKGLELNSKELEFYPKKLEAKDLKIKISTAGSIGLVLQAVLLVTSQLKKSIKIEIEGGGTWNKWAPPVLYLEKVLFPLLKDETEIKIIRDGFYPKGGAQVEVITKPLKLEPIEYFERTEIKEINGFSIASKSLEKSKVAERQAKTAKELIKQKFNKELNIETKYVDSFSPGSGVLIYIKTENSVIGGDSLGEIKKSAEDVAKEAVKNLIFEYANGVIDRHAADMLLSYIVLNSGKIQTSEITHHVRTNISVIETFLPVKFEINEKERIINIFQNLL
jgi:RNA 3'-terminal phosphate cyclase (ATP)/RNA 3'-terminal phosphate cyclase (GTP)